MILDIISITKDDFEGIAQTIASTRALRQQAVVRQWIVDSSARATSTMVESVVMAESNVSLVRQPAAGISAAFNLGISQSTADWIWFLNGRDVVHPSLDPTLLLQILRLSSADLLICQLEFMQSGVLLRRPPLCELWPPLYGNWIPHPASFIRRSVFERFGNFNLEYSIAMDADLWVRLLHRDISVDLLSIPVVRYDQTGISAVNRERTDKEARRIVRSNIGMFTRKWLGRGAHLFKSFTGL